MCIICTQGGNFVEIKTEVDSNDIAECSHDDQPRTGIFQTISALYTVSCCGVTSGEVIVHCCTTS